MEGVQIQANHEFASYFMALFNSSVHVYKTLCPLSPCVTALPIRLVGGAKSSSFHSGRVEVFIHGQWGTVCDNSWSSNDARVVCRRLGYTSGAAYRGAVYGEGTGPIWLDFVICLGYESSLLNCRYQGRNYCSHQQDASVACYNGEYIYPCCKIDFHSLYNSHYLPLQNTMVPLD